MDELIDELRNEFRRNSGIIAFTRIGLKQFSDSLPWTVRTENPDPSISLGRMSPTAPNARADARWHKSEIESSSDPLGWLDKVTTQSWIALTAARWEGYYRPKFAKIAGAENHNKVTSAVMADIHHMRNDIMHNKGIASKTHTGRNQVLKRFSIGDEIILVEEDIWLLSDNLNIEIVH